MTGLYIVSDAWAPQVNGVVRTLEALIGELEGLGVAVEVLSPAGRLTMPCPTDPSIGLAFASPRAVVRALDRIRPDYIHIATEGPLGWAARRACLASGRSFTTSFHTRFPEYLEQRLGLPSRWTYPMLRAFHNAGTGCMVSTASLERDLASRGFRGLMQWPRGVDAALFRPRADRNTLPFPRPVFLAVGRVAPEKNLPAFLGLDLPGSKVVVGEGPSLAHLRNTYPEAHFLGLRTGEDLAAIYASADVLVFPSRTDTFGNVILEGLACGLPVAAFPVTGPLDLIGNSGVGAFDEDLRIAALAALNIPRVLCRKVGASHSWRASAEHFLANAELASRRPPEATPKALEAAPAARLGQT